MSFKLDSSTNLALTQVALIAASCCAGPIRSLVVVVVVACCCCIPYRLALMLALTFAPCVLTFAPCAYGVSLLSTGATVPLAQEVVVTSCNLCWWCFILQPLAQMSTCTHGGSLSATCAGGAFSSTHWHKYCTCTRATIYIYIYICSSYYTLSMVYCVYCTRPRALRALGSRAVKYAIRH